MEVECKRKDGSWHPCQISLSEGNAAIIVAYENSGEEEEEEERIESMEDGLARLRYRSAFLQGGECSQLTGGQHVLALHESSDLFFDAIVEKINKVRHSDRLACRCTFLLKWLPTHLKDQKVKVSSPCIMQLSDKNIETHQVLEAFMASINSSAEIETPASSFNETLLEVDLDGLLAKQVQDISFLGQGINCSKDAMVGLKKANQKGVKIKKSPEPNSGRRVTRSNSKPEIKSHLPLEIKPPLEEAKEKAGNISFLSPLAARAALASFISTLPVSELPKQPKKLHLPPKTSKEVDDFPLLSPLAPRAALASFASALPASGLPKQAKKPHLTPNILDKSDTARRGSVNLGFEKDSPNPVIPRRVTRSAAKIEVVDLTSDRQQTQDQKVKRIEKGNRDSGTDGEDLVTPVKTENKKRIYNSPSSSAATSTSISTNTISDFKGETYQDVESSSVSKKRKIVSRKPPTRFSPRLAQLERDVSQMNK